MSVDQLEQFRGRPAHHGAAIPPPTTPEGSSRRQRSLGRGRRHRARAPREGQLVIGRLDPWSVLKMAVLFNLSVGTIILIASVIVWVAADAVGLIDNVEQFATDLGFVDFDLLPTTMLRAGAAMTGICTVFGTFVAVIWAVLFNLITDVTGGMEMTLRRGRG